MVAFTGPSKLRSIKGENCSVTFVSQLSREGSVDQHVQQSYMPFQEGIRFIVLFYQSTKFEECPEL